MKIHQYNEMMRYLTRPQEDPSIKQLAASVQPKPGWQYAPWQDYPEDDDIPSVQKRAQLKPGGLVEPGVTHYATEEGTLTKAEIDAMVPTRDERRKLYKENNLTVEGKSMTQKRRVVLGEDVYTQIDDYITETTKAGQDLSRKGIGEALGYKKVKKGQSMGQGAINKVIAAYEKARGIDLSPRLKDYKLTKDSAWVKEVIKVRKETGSTRAAAKALGVDRKTVRNITEQFASDLFGKVNLRKSNKWNYKAVRAKRERELIKRLGGKDNVAVQQYMKLWDDVVDMNEDILEMSDDAIWKNQRIRQSMNLDVTGLKIGDAITFDKYKHLSKKEFVAKVKDMASKNSFYTAEHSIPIASEKLSAGFPKNLQVASGKIGSQLEAIKLYIKNNPNGKHIPALNNFLDEFDIQIREGGKTYGWNNPKDKAGLNVFRTDTGTSDIVQSAINKSQTGKQITKPVFDQSQKVYKLLQTAKTVKGPARLKALNAIVATVGTAAAASLFDKFGIDSAMADTGAKSSGVTTGDFFLAGAAPLATKKGRSLYGKAAKAAFKSAATVPGFLAVEAFAGPGIVSSMGGTFSEALASPLLLEGTIRDKRIYDQLKKEGYNEDQIQVIKDSVMLRADVGDTGLHTSMIPLQEMEHKGKKYTAGDPELKNISMLYDKAAGVIAEEDKARLKRADEFDYLQLAKGGRVPFKLGGIDKGRRAFMKWLAGLTGAGIAAGTGLLKWGKVAGKGKTAVQVGDTIVQSTPGMPDWFIPLINRIVKEGDDVTAKLATKEREIVYTKKIEGEEVTVYQNLDTGNVRVDYNSPYNMGEGIGPVSLEYKAPQVIDEGKHAGKKTNPEFEAYEPEPVGYTHGPDDYAIEWDGTNIVGRAEDLVSDTSKLKQFATKKKPTMGEIVTRKKKIDEVDAIHKNESDYIATKQGEGDWDDYLPDIDDMDY